MIFFINQKEGFHEDEIFSYGSSNYNKDNLFQPHGEKDYFRVTVENEILYSKKPLKNFLYNIVHPNEFLIKINEEKKGEVPIWKTKENAKEYLTIQSKDILNFFSIYINQSLDAHPPLFYFLVHIMSALFFNNFSKYIIFIINILLFIGCCIFLRKIMYKLNKGYLSIPVLVLYGFSIGAISTVIFQRMYMLLTFFVVIYTYMIVSYLKNDFNMDKKFANKLKLIIILGFLTQYFFCVYIICTFIILEIIMYKKKNMNACKDFLRIHVISAIIGIAFYPASIYHIFFSYRGVPAISNNLGILDFFELICKSYSVNIFCGIIFLILLISIAIYLLVKQRKKIIAILLFSVLSYIIIISKISPYLDMRYIMCILPIVSIIIWLAIDSILLKLKNKNIIISILVLLIMTFSFYTIYNKKPLYLYIGYSDNISIAKENSNLSFIYVEDNCFNHIQSMPEFMIYNKSLILDINKNELKFLKFNKDLQEEECFIVSIKKYLDVKNIVNEIMNLTNSKYNELLLSGESQTQNVIYKFYK